MFLCVAWSVYLGLNLLLSATAWYRRALWVRVLWLLPLPALLYLHFSTPVATLIHFSLVFRLAALMLMCTGGAVLLMAFVRRYYSFKSVKFFRRFEVWRFTQFSTTAGLLLFVSGVPIYWPTVLNFWVVSLVGVYALVHYLLQTRRRVRPLKARTVMVGATPDAA